MDYFRGFKWSKEAKYPEVLRTNPIDPGTRLDVAE